jgi:hypothetical protein
MTRSLLGGVELAVTDRLIRVTTALVRTHGIRYFHSCYGIGDDQLWGVVRERKGGDHTQATGRRHPGISRFDQDVRVLGDLADEPLAVRAGQVGHEAALVRRAGVEVQ